MLSSERTEFETLISQLFAGFPSSGVQTPNRIEAYWKGLQKLGLVELTRLVEFALSEHGPDRLPSVPQLWRMRSEMRRTPKALEQPRREIPDHLEFFANRLLWSHVRTRGGLGSHGRFAPGHGIVECRPSEELRRVFDMRRDLVREFRQYVADGDDLATPEEFCRRWLAALTPLSAPTPAHCALVEGFRRREASHKPFPRSMARALCESDYASAA